MSRSVTTLALAALALTSFAGSASAQKGKKDDPKPMAGMAHADNAAAKDARRVEHAQQEAAKDQAKAIKEQEKDRAKATKEQDKDRAKAMKEQEKDRDKAIKGQEKVVKRADHRANRDMKRAFGMAMSEQAHLAKGLKLSPDRRREWKEIDRKYDAQYRDLRKEMRAAEQAGRPMDPAWTARSATLREQERVELRGLLTPAQLVVFNGNVGRQH